MNKGIKIRLIKLFLTKEEKDFYGMEDLFVSLKKIIPVKHVYDDFFIWIHGDTLKYSKMIIPGLDENIEIVYDLFGVFYLINYITFMTSLFRAIDDCHFKMKKFIF